MIKLNKNIYVGMLVEISPNLSWQTAEAHIEGTYGVTELKKHTVLITRLNDGKPLLIETVLLQYLTGTECEPFGNCVGISIREYMPSRHELNFVTDTDDESDSGRFNFIYYGSAGKYNCLNSHGVINCEEQWCYLTLPWWN